MLSKTINLKNKLISDRKKLISDADILAEVRNLLAENEAQRMEIRTDLAKASDAVFNAFICDLLETDHIFHISHIRKLCIDYRLRFLDTAFFKNDIPEEAVTKIRALEHEHQIKIKGFRIAAPSKAFRLKNYDDPLLFAPLGNDYYYLVHKWGNDMPMNRKWFVMPVKNLLNFILACLVISLVITMLIPETKLSRSVPMASAIIFLFAFKSVFAMWMYAFFMTGRKFNTGMWDSPFYNN